MASSNADLAAMVTANDKLLKALIGLLALKDEHLLMELRTVFAMAEPDSGRDATLSDRTWAHVRRELEIITEMVEGSDDDEFGNGDRPPAQLI